METHIYAIVRQVVSEIVTVVYHAGFDRRSLLQVNFLAEYVRFCIRRWGYELKRTGKDKNERLKVARAIVTAADTDLKNIVNMVVNELTYRGIIPLFLGARDTDLSHVGNLPEPKDIKLFSTSSFEAFQSTGLSLEADHPMSFTIGYGKDIVMLTLPKEEEHMDLCIAEIRSLIEQLSEKPDGKRSAEGRADYLKSLEEKLSNYVCNKLVLDYLMKYHKDFVIAHVAIFKEIYPGMKIKTKIKIPLDVRKAIISGENAVLEPVEAD